MLARGAHPAVTAQEIDFPVVLTAPGCPTALGGLATGVQNEITLYATPVAAIEAGKPRWTPVCTPADQVIGSTLRGDELYLLSHQGASRYKVLKTRASAPSLSTAAVVVPASSSVITGLAAARDAVYVQDLDAGLGGLRRLHADGRIEPVALPFQGAISALFADPTTDGCWFSLAGWVRPPVICRVGADGRVTQTAIAPKPPIDVSPYDSVEVMAPARDGTPVPLSIVYRRDLKRDGSAPALIGA